MKFSLILVCVFFSLLVHSQTRLNGNVLSLSDGRTVETGSYMKIGRPSKGSHFAYIFNEISLRASSEDDLPYGVSGNISGKEVSVKRFLARTNQKSIKYYTITTGSFLNIAIDVEQAIKAGEILLPEKRISTGTPNSAKRDTLSEASNGASNSHLMKKPWDQASTSDAKAQGGSGSSISSGVGTGSVTAGAGAGLGSVVSSGAGSSGALAGTTGSGAIGSGTVGSGTVGSGTKGLAQEKRNSGDSVSRIDSGLSNKFAKEFKRSDSINKTLINSKASLEVKNAAAKDSSKLSAVPQVLSSKETSPSLQNAATQSGDLKPPSDAQLNTSGSNSSSIGNAGNNHEISTLMTVPAPESVKPVEVAAKPLQAPEKGSAASGYDKYTKLKQLKELLDSGVLSKQEFDAEKKKVLAGN